jgi:dipeptidyl aminopeptidase/acylaminoacyl peptidase
MAFKYTLYAVLFILLLSLWGFYLALRPFKYTTNITPADMGVKYDNVTFKTSDGVTIKGWYVPSEKKHAKTILLLHGYPADKGDILPTRLFLHKNYNLLFMDFRYLGDSGGHYSTVGVYEVNDVRAAIAYLKSRGVHELGIWGLSMGGAAALMTLKHAPEVKAIVAEAPYARLDWMANRHYPIPGLNYIIGKLFHLWGAVFLQTDISKINPVDEAKTVKIPLLLIYSRNDQVVSVEHAELMQRETAGNHHVEMIIVDDKSHNEVMDNYREVVGEFFRKNLG